MYTRTALPDGLERLIRTAMDTAHEAGQIDVVSRLESALHLSQPIVTRFDLDILAGEVRRSGMLVPLSRGERALLMALAIQRRSCTRAELVEMLYPHLDESNGATQLKVYVHRVRRRLGDPQAILFTGNGYLLGPNMDVDYWQVQTEIAEATRGRGGLSGDALVRLNQFRLRLVRRDVSWVADREWGVALERRLEALLFDVTTRLGEAALAAGDSARAVRFATEIANLDPCDERGVNLLIRAHLVAHDRDAAAQALRRYERTLRQEYNARPSPELIALVS
ncbi:MAG: AfsR/SARP family transcriptional regulator [Polyangiaceae bacterium]